MTTEQNKAQEQELNEQAQAAEQAESVDTAAQATEATDAEVEVVGGEADAEWNEAAEEESQVAQLLAALQSSEEKLKEQQDAVLRARADVENMRRRSEQEIDKARKYALNKFAEELLPVIDNLERALQAANPEDESVKPILEGVEMTHKSFVDTVTKFGLVAIDPQGEAFNPELHQAIGIQEFPDFAANTVAVVLQKGYQLNGRVIRPAMVMVAK